MVVMIMSMTACNVSLAATNNLKMTDLEYNTHYLTDKFDINADTAEFIATKLDEKDFGKIKSQTVKIVDGDGSITIGDGKKKYVINVEDGIISDITTKDGLVVLTLDDIMNAADNGFATSSPEPEEPQTPSDTLVDGNTSNDDRNTTDTSRDTVDTTPAPAPDTTNTDTTSTTTSTTTAPADNSYLTASQKSALKALDTDYNKVNWGVQYSPAGMDGIIISVAPYYDDKYPYLLIAVTNIYNKDVTFSGKGSIKDKYGSEIGTASFYDVAIRPGNTVVRSVFCDGTPTGEIYWTDLELPQVFEESAYWESDWSLNTDLDGYYQVNYTILSNEYMCPGEVTAVLIDAYGNILAVAYDFNADEGKNVSGKIQYFKKEFSGKPADIAMFANALKAD